MWLQPLPPQLPACAHLTSSGLVGTGLSGLSRQHQFDDETRGQANKEGRHHSGHNGSMRGHVRGLMLSHRVSRLSLPLKSPVEHVTLLSHSSAYLPAVPRLPRVGEWP